MSKQSDEFIKDICRAVGHRWSEAVYLCLRCGFKRPLSVYVNGICQQEGSDYITHTYNEQTTVLGSNRTGDVAHVVITYQHMIPDQQARMMIIVNPGESFSLNLPV